MIEYADLREAQDELREMIIAHHRDNPSFCWDGHDCNCRRRGGKPRCMICALLPPAMLDAWKNVQLIEKEFYTQRSNEREAIHAASGLGRSFV